MTLTPTLPAIIALVSAHYGIPEADIASRRTQRATSYARQMAMWLACECTRFSQVEIAEALGGRDRSTISMGAKAVRDKMKNDEHLARVGLALRERLTTNREGAQRAD